MSDEPHLSRNEQIVAYIREHRATYTRESITAALLTAGFDADAVEDGWRSLGAAMGPVKWRPSWKLMLWLNVLGSVGAFAVWQPQTFHLGWLAALIYFSIAGLALCGGYLVVWLADRGHRTMAAVTVLLLGFALLLLAFRDIGVSLILAVPFVAIALGLLIAGPRRRRAGLIAAIVPVLLWLIVTGTCYAPLIRGG